MSGRAIPSASLDGNTVERTGAQPGGTESTTWLARMSAFNTAIDSDALGTAGPPAVVVVDILGIPLKETWYVAPPDIVRPMLHQGGLRRPSADARSPKRGTQVCRVE